MLRISNLISGPSAIGICLTDPPLVLPWVRLGDGTGAAPVPVYTKLGLGPNTENGMRKCTTSEKLNTPKSTTVNALYNYKGHPWDCKKVAAAKNDHYSECVK